jgi:Kef-type K+ transport system membrane component KefB
MALAEFLFILVVILGLAKLMGELAHRIGQPSVLGELFAGMVLGASVLGFVPAVGASAETVSLLDDFFAAVGRPAAVDWFFGNLIPHSESAGHFIGLLAEIGVIILLFRIGLTTNIRELSEVGVKSMMVAAVGVVLPFAGGFAFCEMLDLPRTTSIFVGAALTATSIGITARILTDLGKMKTKEARIILGAAVFDDIIGLIILSVVSDLALTGVVSWGKITWTTVSAIGFFALAIVLGILLAKPLIRIVVRMRVQGALIVTAMCFAFVWALLAEEAGSAVIVGSFAAGLALAETDKYELFQKAFYPISEFFTPIFFVSIGAAVNVRYFNPFNPANHPVLLIGGALLLIAIVGKVLSGYAAWSREIKKMTVGVGMVPRGEVGFIFAEFGRRTGVVTDSMFAAVVVVMAATTFIAPPLLKFALAPPPIGRSVVGWLFSPVRRPRWFMHW